MNEIKFNCYDLAAQGAGLLAAHGKMRSLSAELLSVAGALDPQIKSYGSITHQLAAVQAANDEIGARLLRAHEALDQIVDLYYAAESRVRESVESLPTGAASRASQPQAVAPAVFTSTINRGHLIVEDWLAELIYQNQNDENSGR